MADDDIDLDEDFEDEVSGDIKITSRKFNSFLFVYQAEWQRRLLERYSNEMIFLDATYRTTRYALPLFFLVVKTNVDYQIVATFVIESETTAYITEAL